MRPLSFKNKKGEVISMNTLVGEIIILLLVANIVLSGYNVYTNEKKTMCIVKMYREGKN